MKRIQVLVSLLFLIATSSLAAQDTWVPYKADLIKTTDTVDSNGMHIIKQEFGIQYQNSKGDLLEEFFYPNSQLPKDGKLTVRSEKTQYCYNYENKQAIGTLRSFGHARMPKTESIGHENIGGIASSGFYVYDQSTKQPVGEVWFADASPDIVVRKIAKLSNGGSMKYELTNIQLYSEPDPMRMVIPSGFAISKPVNNP